MYFSRYLYIIFGYVFLKPIAAIVFPSFPSIKDEIFPGFATSGNQVPRIQLTYVHGVPTLPFSIGTPPQQFVGIFDTSSPISWVMSEKCNSTACTAVSSSQKYHPEASSTNFKFPLKVDISYLDGTHVQLKPELDAVTFDGKFTIPRHLVAEAYQVDYPKGYLAPANARLGMGDFGSIDWSKTKYSVDTSDFPSIPNPFAGVFRSKRASGDDRYSTGASKSGSSRFRKRDPLIDSVLASSFFILGVDESLYKGPVYELPLIPFLGFRSPFWKIPVTSFQFLGGNNQSYQNNPQYTFPSGAYGKIDSSSPVLTIPSATADKMNSALGAVYNVDTNLYTISCSAYQTAPWLQIQFGVGLQAQIPPSQYIYKFEGVNGGCYTAIVGGSDNQNIYFGGPFFRSFYLIFHYSGFNVGIAESISDDSGKLSVQTTNGGGPIPRILN